MKFKVTATIKNGDRELTGTVEVNALSEGDASEEAKKQLLETLNNLRVQAPGVKVEEVITLE